MQVNGTAGNDSLVGSFGTDTLAGGAGNDTLDGGYGNDSVDGGAGDDLLALDYGDDTLRGGAGADIFTFNSASGNDLVQDFDPEVDRVNAGTWVALGGVTLRLDGSGNTVMSIAGLTAVTLQGVGQSQWSRIRDVGGTSVYSVSADDYAASTATTGRVTVGGTGTTGRIEATGDADWFAVDVTAGTQYRFTLSGIDGAGGTLSDPYLELRSSSGGLLLSDDDGGTGLDSQISYTATGSGRLYLAASSFDFLFGDMGTYRLSAVAVTAPVADDYAASTLTTGRVTVGAAGTTGSIERVGDEDWFAVDVTAGTQYRFTLAGRDSDGGTLWDPYLRLLTSSGVLLLSDDDSGTGVDSQITYTAASTGRLYLSATSLMSGTTGSTGTYRLSATALGTADDYAATTATTGRVTVGGTGTTGNIETTGDKDWFGVDVVAGTQYRFTLSGVDGAGGTLVDPYLQLLSSNGLLLTSDDDGGTGLDSQITYTAASTGRLYLAAGSADFQTTSRGTYRLSAVTVTAPAADDYAAGTGTTGLLTTGAAGAAGRIEAAGDKDWFAIDLVAGNHYIFTLSGADGGGGTLVNPALQLMFIEGSPTSSDDDGGTGLDSQITYTSHFTGRYYLSVGSSANLASGTGSYRVSAMVIPDDQVSGSMTTGRVAVGGTGTTGTIEIQGDGDWFAVDVTAGSRYRFTLSGVDGGGGTLADPYLVAHSMLSGDIVAQDNDGGTGRDAQITYTATSTETLYLAASTLYQANGTPATTTGTYRLTAELVTTPAPADDYAATTATTGRVVAGGAATTGQIENVGDKDWFAVDVTVGTRYYFVLNGTATSGLGNPTLELLSATGTRLVADDDGGPGLGSQIAYTATGTGRLYLSAAASSQTPGIVGNYQLSALIDDYGDAVTGTGMLAVGGSLSGTIEAEGDKDWFAIDVTAGTQYRFSLSGRDGGGGTVADPGLELRSASGLLLASDDDGGTGFDSLLTYTATSTGRLYLVADASLITPTTGSYRLSASRVEVVDDYAGTTGTTGRVAVGGSATGNLEVAGDSDWFAVDLAANTRYVIGLSGRDGGGGTLSDPLVQIHNSFGTLLGDNDDGGIGADSELSFTTTSAGRYYIAATAYDGAYTGTYRVAVTQAATDDYAGTAATQGTVAVGGSVTGRLEAVGDQDWFAIDLVAGRTYSFTLSGLDGGGGTLDDPWLRLLDAAGQQLVSDDDGGTGLDSLLTFTATAGGRYYLSAEGASDTETGSYRLSASVQEPLTPDPAGPLGGTPADPLFARQWHLNGIYGINVLPVWADYTGSGVRVGVLDQGIDPSHRDLDDNLLTGLSRVAATGAAGGAPQTGDDNHGTAVSGVIAAERNGSGGVGVAYNADLVSYYDPLSSSTTVFAATSSATFLRAIGTVDVLNNSWGFGNFFKSTPNRAFLDDFDSNPFNISGAALARLAAEGRGGKGTVVVQAAGNTGQYGDDTNLHNFQNSRFVITVAATDSNGALASFSTPGVSVLVAAPGVGIVTADRPGAAGYEGGDSATLDGTSFSAPAVAGVVALMLEANPDLGYRDVQEILALSARQIGAATGGWTGNAARTWNGGAMHYSEGFGFGLVDARAAVRLAETWHGQQTTANEAVLSASATMAPVLAIPDDNATGVSTTLSLAGDLTIDRVEVDLSIVHNWIGDLRVTLTSPSGTTYALVDRPGQGRLSNFGSSQDNVGFTFGVAGLLGEQASGEWRLSLSDRDGGITGALTGWGLRAYGNSGSADDNHVFTDEFATLVTGNAGRASITDSDGGHDSLNAAAVTAAVSFDLAAGTGAIGDRAISFTAGAFERAVGGDGADTLTATATGSALLGGRGADTLTGGAGADRLTGGAGDDRITGGGGIDITFYDNPRGSFTLTRDGDGFTLTGPEGTDRLSQVEVAVFNRGALLLGGPGVSLYDEATYLANNPDVAAAVQAGAFTSGRAHYDAYGRTEGRSGLDWFDEDYYLAQYPDIAAAVRGGALGSGLAHWLSNGKAEGRNPSLFFDTSYYLAENPDVAGAVRAGAVTAIDHYLSFGMAEGRAATPFFNAAAYLAANPDVAAAGLNGLKHFLEFGYGEGRLAAVDWDYFG
ncbi:pre-peptidase C-terminal domain-containing protein [Niveispirillum sp. KHB5.9]|uniref:pre-peptidase C-terminal domain-containing protein n=1 Tax=Niveispirillum sp. KHB5.9 TaxID=3400269 RepID=UPI003A8637BC